MNFKHKILKNGLNFFTINIPDSQSVVVTVLVKVGSRYERPEIAGMAHFLEHVFFKGSQNYPKPSDIQNRIDEIGGDYNAITSKETTEFYIRAEKHHFDRVFDALTDMIHNPLFHAEEIEKEKGVVIEEINLYKDNPSWQIYSNLEKLMWPTASLGLDVLGTKSSVLGLDRDKIFKFKIEHYHPGNMVLGVSGAIDEDYVHRKIRKYWSGLQGKKSGELNLRLDRQNRPRMSLEYKDTQQAQLALGFRSFGHNHRMNPAILLLANVLGGSTSSRLWINIREQKGFAYNINASNSTYKGAGHFIISAGLRLERTAEALREILSEIRKIKSDLVSEKEITLAKNYIRGKMALVLEDNKEKIDWLLERFAITGKAVTFEEFYKQIKEVTAKDIQKAANEVFRNQKMSLALIGPFKKKKDFEKELYIKGNF